MEDNIIEKQLVKDLEKKKNKKLLKNDPGSKNTKVAYVSEEISSEDNKNTYNIHFDQNFSSTKPPENKKFKLYNELIGEYSYKGPQTSLYKQSYISSLLMQNDLIKKITLDHTVDIQDKKNFYPLFFKYLDNYRDVQVDQSDLEIRTDMMKIYLFHILNHICKRKEEIEVNNNIEKILNESTLTKQQQATSELFVSHEREFITKYYQDSKKTEGEIKKNDQFIQYKKEIKESYSPSEINDVNIKDQGFTSPKVLILVPYKKHARLIIEEIINVFRGGEWKGVNNKKKFKDEYQEFDSLDDCFRLGIRFSFFDDKLYLYSPFTQSDIIIASPLGLKLSSSSNGDTTNRNVFDFLSSIEILLVDFSEVFIYQNMEHLNEILSFLNKSPKNNQNIVSIDRIKDNYINNKGSLLRQSIIISHFKSLEIDVFVSEYCENINGRVNMTNEYINQVEKFKQDLSSRYEGLSEKLDIRFEFKMLYGLKGENDYDDKYKYFSENLWIPLTESFKYHTLIFVSSPFDYYRLKSFFKIKSKSVCFINEDTDKRDWQRNRLMFENGKIPFLLYSERGHFYKKINLRFAKNIVFYSLPEDPKIFREILELIDPINYEEKMKKYNITLREGEYQNFSSVMALSTPIEKYNLEKCLGNTGKKIIKNKQELYSC